MTHTNAACGELEGEGLTAGPSEVRCGPWSIPFPVQERRAGRHDHLSSAPAAGAAMRRRREKVFGPGRAVPLDGNAKARIQAYARAWSGRNRQPGQHKGPITRAFLDVLEALLWGFHNSRTGCCFPSTKRSPTRRSAPAPPWRGAEGAGVAGVLSWQHRLTRIREGCTDLFGRHGWRWRVIRTSNAYVFSDPKAAVSGFASKSENPTGTLNQEILISRSPTSVASDSPLERALARFGAVISKQDGIEQGSGA